MSLLDNPLQRHAEDTLRWLVYGTVVCLLLGRRLFVEILYAAAFVEAAILYLRRSWRELPVPFLAAAAIALATAGLGMMTDGSSDSTPDAVRSLLLFPIATMAVCLTTTSQGSFWVTSRESTLLFLLGLFVTIHFTASQFRPGHAGLFSNPHYLALYAALSLPVYVYLLPRLLSWRRLLAVGLLLLDFAMLLQTRSRPAWLAVMLGAAVTLPFLSVRLRLATSAALIGVPSVLYLSNTLQFRERIAALLDNLATEERVAIWSEAWLMQTKSPAASWYWGHGFAGFATDFPRYSSFHGVVDFVFPHNFALEILYVSGIPILVGMTAAILWLFLALVQTIRRHPASECGTQALLLFSVLTIHLSHTFLTVPFYSRYSLIPLSLLFGVSLRLISPKAQ